MPLIGNLNRGGGKISRRKYALMPMADAAIASNIFSSILF